MKLNGILVILTILCCLAEPVFCQNSNPVVSNVKFEKRTDGSIIVDVTYDVSDVEGNPMTVTMLASEDGGTTWNFSCNNITGHKGAGITSGAGKKIVWNFGAEHPNYANNQIRIKIIADDGVPDPPILALPLDGETNVLIQPTLSWSSNLVATSYRLQVATDNNFSSLVFNEIVTTGTSKQITALYTSTKYYWKVNAINGTGASNYSSPRNFTTGTENFPMVLVNGGTFTMGETGWAEPLHQVTLSSYYIGKTEVTQGQYQAVMGTNPSYFTSVGSTGPVERVMWYDCISYCNKLSINEGKTPCYSINGNTAPGDWTMGTIVCDWNASGYRLPSEAEWEFAAKGGNSMHVPPYTYSGSNVVGDVAWYNFNSDSTTHAVGEKSANELGIVDMSGNVMEWCWDRYATSYTANSQTNPTGPLIGVFRVLRGGSMANYDGTSRVSNRDYNSLSITNYDVGFRIVRR